MLSVRSDRPVDRLTLAVLREVDSLANELKLTYFVAGAMARDILLTGVFGIATGRATRDVDFAIAVESWQHFEAIKARLIDRKVFEVAPKAAQRLYYKPQPKMSGYPLDIIPFRGVEQPQHTVAWPPDMMIMMNVVGYEEALATAQPVEVAPDFAVQVTSLPGLALLKLFAWADRGEEDPKDALDLVILFHSYADAGNQGRLYEEEIGLLEAVDYDLDLAAPRLLGQDIRAIAARGTLEQLRSLLGDVAKMDRLATHMAKGMPGSENGFGEAQRLLGHFRAGVTQE